MSQPRLVTSRAIVERNYAILPPEGVAPSVFPEWRRTVAKVLAAPAMGANFVETLLEIEAGGGCEQELPPPVEAFFYMLEGEAMLEHRGGGSARLQPGGFAYLKPGSRFALIAEAPCRVLWLKKVYQPFGSLPPHDVIGHEQQIAGETYQGIEGLILKTLLPAELSFDMAMNIFTFPPGCALPVIETHVMEHGLYFLQGMGVYYLGHTWSEVKEGDFIWMGPFVPQSFYAAGPTPSRYLYYKDVHRDVDP